MEKKKRLKPNSRELLRRDSSTSWSDLPRDLLSYVFERLGFADFQRAKSVCLSWHFASKQSVPKVNQIPWLILFPEEEDNNNKNTYSCTLFNPEEKERLYKTQDMGLEFAKSVCRATYGSWLLMQDPCCNLYIVNLFSKERINLPPVESQLGKVKVERIKDDVFRTTTFLPNRFEHQGYILMESPVFWIDENTKDYIVIWRQGGLCVAYSRKVDSLWKQIPVCCCDMVYKDHKLYLLGYHRSFKIFDFSGEIPLKIFEGEPQHCQLGDSWSSFALKLVVTVTGEVLMVERFQTRNTLGVSEDKLRSLPWSFRVIKVYSPGSLKKNQLINSLGDEPLLVDQGITELANDESMILDQGITKLANDIDGFITNSIYFSGTYDKNAVDVFLFNLKTRKTESLLQFDCSSVQFSGVQWFLPSFTHT